MNNQEVESFTYLGKQFSSRFGENFFTAEVTKAVVCETYSCCDPHAEYEIIIRQGKQTWKVHKRYREFLALKDNCDIDEDIEFPPKTYYPTIETSFIANRRELLQSFLDKMLRNLSEKRAISKDSNIWKFLHQIVL